VNVFSRIRASWRARLSGLRFAWKGGTPAWLLSLLLHLGLLVLLTMLAAIAAPPVEEVRGEANVTLPEPEEQLTESDVFEYSDMPQEGIGASGGGLGLVEGEAAAGLAMAPALDLEAMPTQLDSLEGSGIPTEPVTMGEEIRLATGPKFSENVIIKGAAGVGAVGAGGAIDRLTQEIVQSLEQRPTLVVWLFDQSGSLARQRDEILERFHRIYEELGVIEASQNKAFARTEDKPLLTSIAAFGKDITFLTPKPTDDIGEITEAVKSIQTDTSGIEHTFGAVAAAIDRYKPLRTQEPRRNVKIIVLTDEVGDDEARLDATVNLARQLEIPIYCIGVPAPFGRLNVSLKYVDPDPKYNQDPQWIPVRQGPETMLPELVQIGDERDDPIDSGFGPYALERLCYDTGGIFFAVHPDRDKGDSISRAETSLLAARMRRFFDGDVMLAYRPDYISRKEYQRLINQNGAMRVLVEAARQSWITPIEQPETTFLANNEADLANRLTRAQLPAARLEPKIDGLYQILLQGKKDRPKVTTPRWQAGYDLSLGRVLAMKVRTEGYNTILGQARGMRFKNPKNNTWKLERSKTVSTGSIHEKQAAEAIELLERVKNEHPGTPWAHIAQEELNVPLGWQWKEDYTEPPKPNPRPNNPSPPRKPDPPKPVRTPKL